MLGLRTSQLRLHPVWKHFPVHRQRHRVLGSLQDSLMIIADEDASDELFECQAVHSMQQLRTVAGSGCTTVSPLPERGPCSLHKPEGWRHGQRLFVSNGLHTVFSLCHYSSEMNYFYEIKKNPLSTFFKYKWENVICTAPERGHVQQIEASRGWKTSEKLELGLIRRLRLFCVGQHAS